ncbi:MAG: hypothetical protein R2939_14400 [Kofleriaceae bacterium]
MAACGTSVTCTGPGDSQCGACDAEFYLVNGVADSCSACTPACGAGTFESTACLGTSDRACTGCTPVAACATG